MNFDFRSDGSYGFLQRADIEIKKVTNSIYRFNDSISELKKVEFRIVNKKLEGILNAIPDLLFEVILTVISIIFILIQYAGNSRGCL
jgi:ABC-type proline/glycine betaine transport system permease subunit